MILADKIASLRKKYGWSQEELAEKLDVSRQSVSKWEGAQSIPDIGKIVAMSELFGVSTDYLLKDEIEYEERRDDDDEPAERRRVSLEEANEYLEKKQKTVLYMVIATCLCILSPAALIVMATAELPEVLSIGVGLSVIFVFVAIAVAMYIACYEILKPFEYLDNEIFETEYGVSGIVNKKRKDHGVRYTVGNIIGTSLCILSPLPLIIVALITENGFAVGIATAVLLLLVAGGVGAFLAVGIPEGAYERLLKYGEYSDASKSKKRRTKVISLVYWLVVVAVYLGYNFITDDWGRSWKLWPVAALLYAAIEAIAGKDEE